jgi:hypothetical protein
MIKTIAEKREQAYCDICGAECSRYGQDKDTKYDFCGTHQKVTELVAELLKDQMESARRVVGNILDDIEEQKKDDVLDLVVAHLRKDAQNKKEEK